MHRAIYNILLPRTGWHLIPFPPPQRVHGRTLRHNQTVNKKTYTKTLGKYNKKRAPKAATQAYGSLQKRNFRWLTVVTLVLSLQRTSVLLWIIAVIQLKLLTLQVTNEGEHKKYKTYPSLGSRASPRGEVRLSDIRAIRQLPSRSDTSIWSVCISFQYKLPPIQSTASPLRNKFLSTSCQAKLPNFHVRVDNKEI